MNIKYIYQAKSQNKNAKLPVVISDQWDFEGKSIIRDNKNDEGRYKKHKYMWT